MINGFITGWTSFGSLESEMEYEYDSDYAVEKKQPEKIVIEGSTCKKCKEYSKFSEPNQPDGTFICYVCRNRV